MPVDPASVKIVLGPYGVKELSVNDTDLTDSLYGFELHVGSGQAPVLVLHVQPGDVSIEGPGIVEVGGPASELAEIDPSKLEQLVLNDERYSGLSIGSAVLAALKDMFNGVPG